MENKTPIYELRQRLEMTQAEFSKYFEIPLATLRNWEQGRTKCPDYLLKLMWYKADIEFF